mmetsp:Transcript_5454/g.14226  ORF Transcript_5454/g.14226 Transcript_5454/m.14226 type:complete len:203 (+) Transcript_5454:176-784(+)
MARNADSGYKAMATWDAPSSGRLQRGVFPNSVRFASNGTPGSSLANAWYWDNSVTASTKSASAPAATYSLHLAIDASRPSVARASVLAMMKKDGSRRPSTAAVMRWTISSVLTICLFGLCPQRFATTWSSMWTPATPTASRSSMVRLTLNMLGPKPVSMSTSSGVSGHTLVILLASSATSASAVTPRSGTPRLEMATPPPDR